MAARTKDPSLAAVPLPSEFESAYREHTDFVWRALWFMGVRRADLPDVHQEVFLTFFRKEGEWDRARPLRAWLWMLALGLVQNYRRRAFRRLEVELDEASDRAIEGGVEDAVDAARARRRALRALELLDPEKRAVFVMFEVEAMSGKEIAEELSVPIGTVHSRLHAARRVLAAALAGEMGEEDA